MCQHLGTKEFGAKVLTLLESTPGRVNIFAQSTNGGVRRVRRPPILADDGTCRDRGGDAPHERDARGHRGGTFPGLVGACQRARLFRGVGRPAAPSLGGIELCAGSRKPAEAAATWWRPGDPQ